jgi:O-antigen ligase
MTLQRLENWFVCLSLVFLIGNPINVLLYGESGDQVIENAQGSFLEPGINMGIYAIALLFMLMRWRKVLHQIGRGNVWVWALVALILLSTSWSVMPEITLRRGMIVAGATLYGTYFATCFSFKQQLQFLALAFGGVALLCLGFGLLLPHYGRMRVAPHDGAWRGVYIHKQALGIQMTLSAAFFLTLLKSTLFRSQRRLIWTGLLGCIFLLIASRSSTGLVAFLTIGISLLLFHMLQARVSIMAPVLSFSMIGVGGIGFYAVENAESIFKWFGRDLSFTGRDILWSSIWEMINRRSLFGYGYEAFWTGAYSEPGIVQQAVGWEVPHAHNGLLELLLAVGWVGALLYLLVYLINLFRALQFIRIYHHVEAFYPLVFLLYLALSNMTEKNLVNGGAVWILFVWVCFLPYASIRFVLMHLQATAADEDL